MTQQVSAAPGAITVLGLRSVLRLDFPGAEVVVTEGVGLTSVALVIWEYEAVFTAGAKDGDTFVFKHRCHRPRRDQPFVVESRPIQNWDHVHEAVAYIKQHLNGIVAAIEMAYSAND